jgi:hypothetical protein
VLPAVPLPLPDPFEDPTDVPGLPVQPMAAAASNQLIETPRHWDLCERGFMRLRAQSDGTDSRRQARSIAQRKKDSTGAKPSYFVPFFEILSSRHNVDSILLSHWNHDRDVGQRNVRRIVFAAMRGPCDGRVETRS